MSFRLKWLQMQHNRKTKSKEETHEKQDEVNAGREFVTAAQLRAHYKSRKAARNHIRHCEQNPDTIRFNKFANEKTYLLLSMKSQSRTKKKWSLKTRWEDWPETQRLRKKTLKKLDLAPNST